MVLKNRKVPTDEQKKKYAEAILRIESGGRRGPSSGLSFSILAREGMEEAARYMLDNRLFAYDKYRHHYEQQALRTLIKSGNFEYLDEYWNGYVSMLNRDSVNFYSHDFIMSAFCYVAKNQPDTVYGDNAFSVLVQEWARCCPELSVKWFAKYVESAKNKRNEQVRLANKVADSYFDEKKYDLSAGWYLAVVNLSMEDDMLFNKNDLVQTSKILFRRGMPLDDAINESVKIAAKIQIDLIERAKRRLKMISDAGIETVPLYE